MVSRGRGRRRVGPEILCPTRFFRLILRAGGTCPRGSGAGKSMWGQGLAREAVGRVQGRSYGGQRGWEGSGVGGLEGGRMLGFVLTHFTLYNCHHFPAKFTLIDGLTRMAQTERSYTSYARVRQNDNSRSL